jgi:hypothetical protein
MKVGSKEVFVSTRLGKSGIRVGGLHYNSYKLQEIGRYFGPGADARVRENLDDAACVDVYDRVLGEWIKVPVIK